MCQGLGFDQGEQAMDSGRIRVGIIGAGGWAKYGHIPALEALEEFEVVAVSNRKMATAEGTAKQFHLKHAFGDEQSLINHPDVDLVAVVAPAPRSEEHTSELQSLRHLVCR